MVDLDSLAAEVEQDGAVHEPLIGAEVPDQPHVMQGSAGKSGKAMTVRCGNRLQSLEPMRSVTCDAEVEHVIILPPSAPSGAAQRQASQTFGAERSQFGIAAPSSTAASSSSISVSLLGVMSFSPPT